MTYRHFNYKCCSFANFALDFDGAVMREDELFGDCETKPTVDSFCAGFTAAPESVEDKGDVFRGDALTCDPDSDLDSAAS